MTTDQLLIRDLVLALEKLVARCEETHGKCLRFEPDLCEVCAARAAIAKAKRATTPADDIRIEI